MRFEAFSSVAFGVGTAAGASVRFSACEVSAVLGFLALVVGRIQLMSESDYSGLDWLFAPRTK